MTDPIAPPDAAPDVIAMARLLLDLDLPEPCVAGVTANLAALADHVCRLESE